jgi:broad specificity phosphatase PhoE
MVLKITYFVHGTTVDNEQKLASGQADAKLSKLGIEQSKQLKGQVNQKFDAMFCSDLSRSIDTAKLAFEGTAQIIIDKRLREVNYGDFTQKKKDWDILDYISQYYPKGESYTDVETRIRDFLSDMISKYDGKHIAIVAHQDPQLALDVITKNQTWQQAIANDWRKIKAWKPGWEYTYTE